MYFHFFPLLLVCAHAASAAIYNNSSIIRTFAMSHQLVTDEPLDLRELGLLLDHEEYYDPVSDPVPDLLSYNRSATVRTNLSRERGGAVRFRQVISDEAWLFLTGPLSTVFIPSLYTLVCLLSVALNGVALLIFVRRVRPKKPAVIYMMNLACADLLFSLLLPFRIAYHFNGNDWVFGAAMCRLVTAAFYCNMYCSALLIACISVDRLLAVVYPIDSLSWRRPRTALLACAAMWVLSVAGSVPLVLSEQTVYLSDLDVTTCHDIQDLAELRKFYLIYFPTLSCALFFLPLLVTAVCYSRVIWSLSRVPRGAVGHSRRKARAMVMALTVLVLFVVCYAPTNCLLLAHYLQFGQSSGGEGGEAPDGTYAAYLVCLCVGSLSCCLDPLVYYFGSSQCQRQLAGVFGSGQRTKGGKPLYSSSHSSRTSSAAILKSSLKTGSVAKTPIAKMDSFQAGLSSQYRKLLV